jgi:hypothetical protein
MRRRDVLVLIGGATTVRPLGTHAQPAKLRRIAILRTANVLGLTQCRDPSSSKPTR